MSANGVSAASVREVERFLGNVVTKAPSAATGRVALRYPGAWKGPDELVATWGRARVVACRSALAVREALSGNESLESMLLLLVDTDERDLGIDVVARLVKRRVFELNPWQSLLEAFGARDLDPRLAQKESAPLVSALLDCLPTSFVPFASNFLDQRLAWDTWFRTALEFPLGTPDDRALLEWALVHPRDERMSRLPKDLTEAARGFVTKATGPLAGRLFQVLVENPETHLVAAGLAARSVFDAGAEKEAALLQGAVRLERTVAGPLAPDLGLAWAKEAEAVFLAAPERSLLTEAEALVVAIGAESGLVRSRVLPRGFSDRLASLGRALWTERGKKLGDLARAEAALESVRDHASAARERKRFEAAEMAVRLLRWLSSQEAAQSPMGLGAAVDAYVAEGSFVDLACDALTQDESVSEAATAYRGLRSAARSRRSAGNRVFAEALAAAPPDLEGRLAIENVLSEIVAPLAKRKPVLLVVLDGMSWPVFRMLERDLSRSHLVSLAPVGKKERLTAVAMLPTVTEVSRASLLMGRRTRGLAEAEKLGFELHAELRDASKGAPPPRLFHKAELLGPQRIGLSDELVEDIQSKRRVVGVVLNAVDDYLLKGDQLHPEWTVDQIAGLSGLLERARVSQRTVVITADHGHVRDRGMEGAPPGEGGERYRTANAGGGPLVAQEGEVLLEGPRVLMGDGRIAAPWSEDVRYGGKRNGYHGGATPQEVLVPVAVLDASVDALPGWEPVAVDVPAWWLSEAPREAPPVKKTVRGKKEAPPTRIEDNGPLFAAVEVVVASVPRGPEWLEGLLVSERFKAERERAGFSARIEDATLVRVLVALDELGLDTTPTALARRLSLSEMRLSGHLRSAANLLNVDGYAVLQFDARDERVALNVKLLREQFL